MVDEKSSCKEGIATATPSLDGYSEAARRAIQRRLEEEPEEGPDEEDFDRAIKRSAEERTDD